MNQPTTFHLYCDTLEDPIGLTEEQIAELHEHVPSAKTLGFFRAEQFKNLWADNSLADIGIEAQMRVQAYAEWIFNHGDEIPMTEDDMETTLREQLISSRPKISNDAKPERPEKYDGNRRKWKAFRRTMESYLAMMKTPQGISYSVVIKNITLPNEDTSTGSVTSGTTTLEDDEIATKPALIEVNQRVYHELKLLLAHGTAFEIIRQCQATSDGRRAWTLLVAHYEGTSVVSSIKADA